MELIRAPQCEIFKFVILQVHLLQYSCPMFIKLLLALNNLLLLLLEVLSVLIGPFYVFVYIDFLIELESTKALVV